jgi:hypothetical protein
MGASPIKLKHRAYRKQLDEKGIDMNIKNIFRKKDFTDSTDSTDSTDRKKAK